MAWESARNDSSHSALQIDFDMIEFETLIDQLVFDILYNKYRNDSPQFTLLAYCTNCICHDWLNPTYENNLHDISKVCHSWMRKQLKREVAIHNNPGLREESKRLGRNPDWYLPYLQKMNIPYKQSETKPKILWDYIYYNGNEALITSKQFKRSFRNQSRNYTKSDMVNLFNDYDSFINKRFMQPAKDAKDAKSYFEISMDFYHLEIYKRIDFIYGLAKKMTDMNLRAIDRTHFAVQRFNFSVLCPYNKDGLIEFTEKSKYYRPMIFLEKYWQETGQFTHDLFRFLWYKHHFIRAKTLELFYYNYVFSSEDYDEMAIFIHDYYNVLSYHEPNKIWVQNDKHGSQAATMRITNALKINEALFWDSEKRKPVPLT